MSPCGVVTLTTDFGLSDGYVGTMKGVLLRVCPDVRIIDITHQVAPQDTLEASLVLQNAYPYFPVGTVHIVVVDPGVGSDRRQILLTTREYFFVGPDNGTFTRILESGDDVSVYEISNPQLMLANISHTFHGRDIFAPAAAYLVRGVPPEEFGPRVTDPVTVSIPTPRIYIDRIGGEVIYVDSFGNIVTNISQAQFDEAVAGRNVQISINGKSIERLQRSYLEGEQGRALALFGSSGLLEIAVAGGRADRRIGAGKGDTVLVRIEGVAGMPTPTSFDF